MFRGPIIGLETWNRGYSYTDTPTFYLGPLVLVIPQPSRRTAKVFEQGDLGTE